MQLQRLRALCGQKPSTPRPQSLRELRVERLLGTESAEDFGLVAAQNRAGLNAFGYRAQAGVVWVSLNSLSAGSPVIPAKAGIHRGEMCLTAWIPAYAGMTKCRREFKVTHYPSWPHVARAKPTAHKGQRVAIHCHRPPATASNTNSATTLSLNALTRQPRQAILQPESL